MSKKISFSNEPRIWFYVNENLVSSKSSQEISEIFLLNNNFYCDSKGSKVKLLSRECLSLDGHERIGFQVTQTIRGQMDKDHFRNHCVSLFLTPGLPIFDNLKIDYCPNCYSMKPEHNYRLCNKIACLKCGEKGCPGDCCSNAAHQNCKKCLFCGCKGHSTFDMKCILFRTAILHSIDSSNFKYDKLFLHVDHLPVSIFSCVKLFFFNYIRSIVNFE